MKLSKKTIFTTVYWAISCAIIVYVNITLIADALSSDDKLGMLMTGALMLVITGFLIVVFSVFYLLFRQVFPKE
jgi:formate/nitrite transporter FocA (FNT family)